MKRKDLWIIGIIIIIALSSILLIKTITNKEAEYEVVIYANETEYKRIPFTESTEEIYKVKAGGGYNTIEIKDGDVKITEADCPDQVCVYTLAIDDPTDMPIVCLPHQVIVRIEPMGDSNE